MWYIREITTIHGQKPEHSDSEEDQRPEALIFLTFFQIFFKKGVDKGVKICYSLQARSREAPPGDERERADRTLKTIQRERNAQEERSRGKADRKGNPGGGSGREAGDAAKDSEDSEEFSVEGKGNRKGNLDRDIEGLNTRV